MVFRISFPSALHLLLCLGPWRREAGGGQGVAGGVGTVAASGPDGWGGPEQRL